ncbi:hypothetical protein KUF71_025215, partial [Frankliniella fusca]
QVKSSHESLRTISHTPPSHSASPCCLREAISHSRTRCCYRLPYSRRPRCLSQVFVFILLALAHGKARQRQEKKFIIAFCAQKDKPTCDLRGGSTSGDRRRG